MHKNYIVISGIVGFLAVALGAFGAHGLEGKISAKMLENYNTGVLYHLVHSAVLLALSLSSMQNFNKAFWAILIGIILFSFSLYIYSVTNIKLLVFITPIGGTSLLVGWILVIVGGLKFHKKTAS